MTTLHAHVETAASDCDGPLYRHWVEQMTDEEKADQFGDLDFRARLLSNHVSFWPAEGAEVTVKVYRDGFDTSEPTEEGYRQSCVRWCEDADCDTAERGQRDVFAERAGY